MAFITRAAARTETPAPGVRRDRLLTPVDTGDGRIVIDRWHLRRGAELAVAVEPGTLAWLQVLDGSVSLAGRELTAEIMTRLASPLSATIAARADADILLSRVPDAARFGHRPADGVLAARSFDWTREPVLQSMHDDRKRIYVATRTLFETSALKGEIIIYPPGATCPEHRHEGAEHYQYVVSGTGVAVLDGVEETLHAGDLLYNLENEWHWFRNDAGEDFVFIEYFVPGTARTIWAPGADICEWQPTGADIQGREPSRHIPRHSHGDRTVV